MPFLKIWVHLVWTTKNLEPVLHKDWREQLFGHIRNNAMMRYIYADCVQGYADHVHCLTLLAATQNIAKLVQQLKGESAHWINQQHLLKHDFAWQDDYFAVSVSESAVSRVRTYLKNQEAYHLSHPFQQEYDAFFANYGFTQSGR